MSPTLLTIAQSYTYTIHSRSPGAGEVLLPLMIMLMFFAMFFLVVVGIGLLIAYFLWRPYTALPEADRQLPAWVIWLLAVPLVNIVVSILVTVQVPASFKRYFDRAGDTSVGDCGQSVAIIWLVLSLILGPFGLIPLILFIVKLYELADKVRQHQARQAMIPKMPI